MGTYAKRVPSYSKTTRQVSLALLSMPNAYLGMDDLTALAQIMNGHRVTRPKWLTTEFPPRIEYLVNARHVVSNQPRWHAEDVAKIPPDLIFGIATNRTLYGR